MPIIEYFSQGSDKVVADLRTQATGLQKLAQQIATCNGDWAKASEVIRAHIVEQGKASKSSKVLDQARREESRTLKQLVSELSKHRTASERESQSISLLTSHLQKLNYAYKENEKSIRDGHATSDRTTQRQRELAQQIELTKRALESHSAALRRAQREEAALGESARRAAMESKLLYDAQRNVNAIIERGVTPLQKNTQEMRRLVIEQKAGAISTQQLSAAMKVLHGERAKMQAQTTGVSVWGNTILPGIRNQLLGISAMFGLGGGIAGSILLAGRELDRFRQQIAELQGLNKDTGQAWRIFASEIASMDASGEELGRFKTQIVSHSQKHGYDESLGAYVGLAALKTAGLTGGKITPEMALETAGFTSSIFRWDRQRAVDVTKGMIDLEKQYKPGELSKEELYGLLQIVNTESRVDDIQKTSQTFPRLLAYYMSTGMDSNKATAAAVADYSMLTQLGVDPTGHVTTYALITQAAKKQEMVKQIKSGEIASEWEEDAHGNLFPVQDSEKIKFEGIDLSGVEDIDDITRLIEKHPEFNEVLKQIKVKGGRFSGGMVRLQGAMAQLLTPENIAAKQKIRGDVYGYLTEQRPDGRRRLADAAEAEENFMKTHVSEYGITEREAADKSRDQTAAKSRLELATYQERLTRMEKVAARGQILFEKFFTRFDSGARMNTDDPDMQKIDRWAKTYMSGVMKHVSNLLDPRKISLEHIRVLSDVQREREAISRDFGTKVEEFDQADLNRLGKKMLQTILSDSVLSEGEKKVIMEMSSFDPKFSGLRNAIKPSHGDLGQEIVQFLDETVTKKQQDSRAAAIQQSLPNLPQDPGALFQVLGNISMGGNQRKVPDHLAMRIDGGKGKMISLQSEESRLQSIYADRSLPESRRKTIREEIKKNNAEQRELARKMTAAEKRGKREHDRESQENEISRIATLEDGGQSEMISLQAKESELRSTSRDRTLTESERAAARDELKKNVASQRTLARHMLMAKKMSSKSKNATESGDAVKEGNEAEKVPTDAASDQTSAEENAPPIIEEQIGSIDSDHPSTEMMEENEAAKIPERKSDGIIAIAEEAIKASQKESEDAKIAAEANKEWWEKINEDAAKLVEEKSARIAAGKMPMEKSEAANISPRKNDELIKIAEEALSAPESDDRTAKTSPRKNDELIKIAEGALSAPENKEARDEKLVDAVDGLTSLLQQFLPAVKEIQAGQIEMARLNQSRRATLGAVPGGQDIYNV